MINKVKIGEKIFTLRKKSGITQYHLSKLLNVDPLEISQWEKGMSLPNTELLPVLAELFDTNFNDILCIENMNHTNEKRKSRVLLHGMKYYNCDFSLISCIKSSLSYLGIHVSTGWISAPYAFTIKINNNGSFTNLEYKDFSECLNDLIKNCGGILSKLHSYALYEDKYNKHEEIFEKIKSYIDMGFPCFIYKKDKLLYYLIVGYDESGYYYIEPNSLKINGPKLLSPAVYNGISSLKAYSIRPGKISSCIKTIKDVFEYAVNLENRNELKANSTYTLGTKAYSILMNAINEGTVDYHNLACTFSFWLKCKKYAVLFLQESKLRIDKFEKLFDATISYYENTLNALNQLSLLFPLNSGHNGQIPGNHKNVSILLLKTAQRNEEKGLEKIRSLLNEIYKIW
ncbi:MAG: helix-turn-helix transcriptional regulator [Epulopiscium sp.]|nr:helix-turn-helix transcriptional regulator [Candidatus Epulonipiscium sp.]HPT76666.1 helix-turn-helix transcriptional regulator [Defluviitaleaceae bacterium]